MFMQYWYTPKTQFTRIKSKWNLFSMFLWSKHNILVKATVAMAASSLQIFEQDKDDIMRTRALYSKSDRLAVTI